MKKTQIQASASKVEAEALSIFNGETKKHIATDSPGTFKKYLTELFNAYITHKGCQIKLYELAESWGRSEAEADQDIRRVENIECAVRLFISKAVDENYDLLTNK
jgi:hypothetical protein